MTQFLQKYAIAALLTVVIGLFSSAEAARAPESFAPLVEKLTPAVVNISTTQTIEGVLSPFENFQFNFPKGSPFEGLPDLFKKFHNNNMGSTPQKVTSLGSGFIIDPRGYIVTNNHVVEKADEISVILSDDTRLDATLIGRDPKTDIAVLKVESDKPLPAVRWGDSDEARVGDWVIAIGNPFGLGGSVSSGIISARARDINAGPFDDFLQTDAAINRGNSGGPLFDISGHVIGVNTAIFSPSGGNVGIGFAAPSVLVRPVVKQLIDHGRIFRGWLGVKIQMVSDDIAESLGLDDAIGAMVVEVTSDSPAEDAGLKVGDVIIAYNSDKVSSMRKLPRMVAETESGTKITLTVWRDGKRKTLKVTLGELPINQTVIADSSTDEEGEATLHDSKEVLGMWLRPVNNSDRQVYGMTQNIDGLLVVKTTSDGVASRKGILAGDVITSANQKSVSAVKDFDAIVKSTRKSSRKAVLLLVQRGPNTQFIALPVE